MKIAVAQMCSGIDPAANAGRLADVIAQAKAGGAEMVFTPEMTGLLDRSRKRAAQSIAPEASDAVLSAARESARSHGIWVALGSLALALALPDSPQWANRSLLIDPNGDIMARYDKMHMFDVDLASGEVWRESAAYRAGDAPAICETPFGAIGLSICYDLRFPALFAALADAGAKIIAVPAAFTVPTGRAHWHILLRARAIENACWIVAAAQCGRHEDGRETYGHSLVISPWGEIVLDQGEATGLGFATIDMTQIEKIRAEVPVLEHRRPIPQIVKQS